MPEYTHDDREMIQTEQTLWNAVTILDDIENGGDWMKKIREATDALRSFAVEIRDYNSQFEED